MCGGGGGLRQSLGGGRVSSDPSATIAAHIMSRRYRNQTVGHDPSLFPQTSSPGRRHN